MVLPAQINEFNRWINQAQQDGHFNNGQTNFIRNKFQETIGSAHGGSNSLNNRINWFSNWVNGNTHLTDGNKKQINKKIKRIFVQSQSPNSQQSAPQRQLPMTVDNVRGISNRSGYLNFYDHSNNLTYFLGNFYPSPISYQGLNFKCVEGAFQSAKFNDPNIKRQFCNVDGDGAWRLARQYANSQRADWFQVNYNVMKQLLITKFADQDLKDLLLASESAYLVEHTPVKGRDSYWADDCDGTGQNMLGKALMEVRRHYGGVGVVRRSPNYDSFLQTGIN